MEKFGLKDYLNYFTEGEHVKTLYVDNYCSEVKSEIIEFMLKKTDKKKLIIAPPGMGKSTVMMEIAKDYKMLFVAPKKGIAEQMADEYERSNGSKPTLLMSESKDYETNVNMNSNLTIAVYDSVYKTNTLDIDIKDSFKVIDEIHQIILAEDYRSRAMSSMLELLGNNTIDITATPYGLPNEGYDILRIEKRVESEKKVKFYEKHKNIPVRDYVKAIVSQSTNKVFIFCNNKNQGKEIVDVVNMLGKKALLATANNYETSNIVKTKRFPKGIDVLVTTEILSDGVSILDSDVSDVIILKNNINPAHLIQVPKRIRLGNPTTHFILADTKANEDINFNIHADKDINYMLLKVMAGNNVYTGDELSRNLGGIRTFCNYVILKNEKYEINNRLLYLDFFTRPDKLNNGCIINMFELNGYTIEFVSYKDVKKVLKTINEPKKDKEPLLTKKISYSSIEKDDKVVMVINTIHHIDLELSNKDIVQEDYKKFTSSAINKIKKIMDVEELTTVDKEIIEIAVELPNNFNRLADIKRALDTQSKLLPWIGMVNCIKENNGVYKTQGKVYTFIDNGKYPDKKEQERIENDLLVFYKNRITSKESFDTFMKSVYKVEPSEDKKVNHIIGTLDKGELYLQGKTIKLM